jgi:dTDP-4-amino-4,6-dideoxygalactose transaminase
VTFQGEAPWGTHSRWLTVMYLDAAAGAPAPEQLIEVLGAANIEARPVWRPMHTQPMFADAARVGGSVAESLFAAGVCLPSSSSLTDGDVARVCDAVRAALRGAPLASA